MKDRTRFHVGPIHAAVIASSIDRISHSTASFSWHKFIGCIIRLVILKRKKNGKVLAIWLATQFNQEKKSFALEIEVKDRHFLPCGLIKCPIHFRN